MTDQILADLTGEQMAVELAALRQRVAELETAASAEQAETSPHREAVILQELADAVIITDQDSIIQSWNRAAEELYGWTAAEAVGRSMSELAPSEYAHEDPAAVRATLDVLGHWRGEVMQRRKDGRRIHVDATVSRLPAGKDHRFAVVAINRDISARREAEAEHRAFFAASVSPAFWVELPEPVSLDLPVDEQMAAVLRTGRIREANEACARAFGLADHRQLQGLTLVDLCDASTFGPEGALRRMAEAFARAGYALEGYEVAVKSGGGAERWFECSLQGNIEDGALQRIWGSAADITARVQAERETHDNELRYQALRRLSHDFVFLHALEPDGGIGHFVEVNEVACRRLGYTQEELRRFGPLEILINPDIPNLRITLDRIVQDGAFTFERELRPRQGEPIPVELHSRILDYKGQRLVLTVGRDLTAQRQAEQALRESEARFAALFRNSPGAMALTRRDDHRLTDVNRAWEELTGYSRAEALNRSPLELNVWLDPAQREQMIARLDEQAVVSLEVWARHKSGQVRELLMSATAIALGSESYLLTMAQDITELRRAQEALREERDRAQGYLDIAAVMLISFDPKGRITLINKRGCEVLGRSEEELLGKDWFETCLAEQERDKMRLLFARLMRSGGSYVEYRENAVLTASGKQRIIAWRNTLLRDTHGRVIGLLSSGEDITERRQAEHALRESETKYHALFDVFPLGITISDPTGQIVETNDTAVRLLGEPKEVQNVRSIYGGGWRIIRPDGTPMPPEEFASVRALQEGRPIEDVEMGIVHADDDVTWINVTAAPLSLENYGIVATYSDITARKKAEHDYQTLFREMLDGFALHEIICDAEGRPVDYCFLAVNPAFERMTGLAAKDVVGRTVLEVLPQTEPHWIETYGQVALTGKPVVFENTSRELAKIFEVTAFSPKLGQFACIFADVTVQRQAQAQLEESEAKFRLLSENSVVGVYIVQEGQFAYVNPSSAHSFGYEPQDIIGKLGPADLVHPDDLQQVAQELAAVLAGKAEDDTAIYRGIRRDGSVIRVEAHAAPTLYQGRPAIMGTVLDVTSRIEMEEERQRMQEELYAYAHELEQRVASRTSELTALFEIASVGSESMDLPAKLNHMLGHACAAMRANAGAVHLLSDEQPWPDGRTRGPALRLAAQQGCPCGVLARQSDVLPCSALALSALLRDELVVARGIEGAPCVPSLDPGETQGSHAFAPVRAQGKVLGVLSVTRREAENEFATEDLALLTSIADQVGPVVESAWLQQLAQQNAIVQERERLGRELHDSVTQMLYSLALQADWAHDLCAAGDMAQCVERINTIGELSHQVLRDMRLLLYELRPSMLEQDGLVGALERRLDAVERRAGLEVHYDVDLPAEIPASLELDLFRIAQEALNNVAKHSRAKTVAVELKSRGGEVLLRITDDGVGFEPAAELQKGGLGLRGMRERAEQQGGRFELTSEPGKGACIKVTIGVG